MAILPVGISGEAGAYQIERSLRFNSSDSANLNRTFSTGGTNLKIRTISAWVKRSKLGITSTIFECYNGSGSSGLLRFTSSDTLEFGIGDSNFLVSSSVYRDPSSWYHIVVAVDTTQATSTNRIKIYVNGVQVTAFGTANYPTQNTDTDFCYAGSNNRIGSEWSGSSNYLDGYMAEFHFIDGQALTPADFGEFSPDTGVWQPKAYEGTYGTNGFYLDFADNSSTTALGYDAAGSNDWTPNNFSVTAGYNNDSLVDSPTRYGTDTGVGGEVRGNYCTLNALNKSNSASLQNGNLKLVASSNDQAAGGTFAMTSGKWYFEIQQFSSQTLEIGICPATKSFSGLSTVSANFGELAFITGSGSIRNGAGGTETPTGFSSQTGAGVIAIAVDFDNYKIWWSNTSGTWFNSANPATGTSASKDFSAISALIAGAIPYIGIFSGSNNDCFINFGQRPFAYTAPSGFKALCTTNLPEPTIADGGEYFAAIAYTGNGSTQDITTGFAPSLSWLKSRGAVKSHRLFDAVRGATKELYSDQTAAEGTSAAGLTSFNADSFSLGSSTSVNNSGESYVAWNWKANGSGVSNTDGSITSTVSANTTAGFSIVTYTGTGSNATVGHGLGVAPSMMIVKQRSGGAQDWAVYHSSLGATKSIALNSTAAAYTVATNWNDTAPTSTVFSIGTRFETNESGATFVAYCFAPVEGFSAFGSYTGNGSTDGPFIHLGFRARYVLWKRSDGVEGWWINDTSRLGYNGANRALFPHSSSAEDTANNLDILSNGFKIRGSGGEVNASGGTYIYAAFAENPFKYALAR